MSTPLEELVAKMTVAELALATGFTVKELVGLVLEDSSSLMSQLRDEPELNDGNYDTRTPEGRDALDAAILAALRDAKQPLRALEIRRHVGGTAVAIRGRLSALLQDGRISSRGVASGTQYFLKTK